MDRAEFLVAGVAEQSQPCGQPGPTRQHTPLRVRVCSNKPISQDKQNLISWRQLTVFKNRLLPVTFPFPSVWFQLQAYRPRCYLIRQTERMVLGASGRLSFRHERLGSRQVCEQTRLSWPLASLLEPAGQGLPGVGAARGKAPRSAWKGMGSDCALGPLTRAGGWPECSEQKLPRAQSGNKCICHQPKCSRPQMLLRI